jgi:hypothetical protein
MEILSREDATATVKDLLDELGVDRGSGRKCLTPSRGAFCLSWRTAHGVCLLLYANGARSVPATKLCRSPSVQTAGLSGAMPTPFALAEKRCQRRISDFARS